VVVTVCVAVAVAVAEAVAVEVAVAVPVAVTVGVGVVGVAVGVTEGPAVSVGSGAVGVVPGLGVPERVASPDVRACGADATLVDVATACSCPAAARPWPPSRSTPGTAAASVTHAAAARAGGRRRRGAAWPISAPHGAVTVRASPRDTSSRRVLSQARRHAGDFRACARHASASGAVHLR
jgi:hypothetical protein